MWRSPLNPADSWKDLQGKYNETDFLTHVGHTAHINLCAASCRFIEVVREASACRPLSMALLFLSYVRYAGITPSLSLGTVAVAFKSSIWHFSAWLLGLLRNVSGLSASLGKVIFPETILSRIALVWCSVAWVLKHFMKCCFLGNEAWMWGRKGFDNLFVGFSEPFVGPFYNLVCWVTFSSVFPFLPCLLAWWVISFMLLVSSAHFVGEPCRLWTMWVQWLNIGGGPYPSVAFIFSGERQSILQSPQTGTIGTILPESNLMRKKNWVFWLVYRVQAKGY